MLWLVVCHLHQQTALKGQGPERTPVHDKRMSESGAQYNLDVSSLHSILAGLQGIHLPEHEPCQVHRDTRTSLSSYQV